MRTRQNSEGRTDRRRKSLHGLLTAAQATLFDFDGPVCGLFARSPTAPAAEEIQEVVRAGWGDLPLSVEQSQDSHGILRHFVRTVQRLAPVEQAELEDRRHRDVTDLQLRHGDKALRPRLTKRSERWLAVGAVLLALLVLLVLQA
ncbi:hypothetical protein ACFC18_50155 [Streptomyces sp. NPDC056121]|uniref:hypothetical protein n=1 Tax=Streptomyces sp. NPDC056121 TaxID=3345718 RepID=UPI0035D74C2F